MAAPRASAIYEGVVRHRRFTPRHHAFHYRVFMLYIDLDELDTLFDGVPFWSSRRPAPAWFRRADYFGDPSRPVTDCVREAVQAATGHPVVGPIRMLTNLRYFGFLMNPVTFYYCFDARGERVESILAEVTNTPWRERHHYVVTAEEGSDRIACEFDKVFTVSPFNPLEQRYRWHSNTPGARLTVHMENWQEGGRITDATLKLQRRALSRSALLTTLARYPVMTLKVWAGIYWQALRLALKRTPFFGHQGSRLGAWSGRGVVRLRGGASER
jgi:DUF1365 family protein